MGRNCWRGYSSNSNLTTQTNSTLYPRQSSYTVKYNSICKNCLVVDHSSVSSQLEKKIGLERFGDFTICWLKRTNWQVYNNNWISISDLDFDRNFVDIGEYWNSHYAVLKNRTEIWLFNLLLSILFTLNFISIQGIKHSAVINMLVA